MANDLACGLEDLLPASWRGVPFEVDSDTESYARRITTHEYPMRDQPFHEDLGERYQAFSVKGYVTGANAGAAKNAIVLAARQRGAGMLQLPAVSGFQAVCLSLNVSRSKDRQGYYDLSFEFRRDDGATGLLVVATAFEQLIVTAASAAVAVFRGYYDSVFNGFGVLPYVVENAIDILRSAASVVTDILDATPIVGAADVTAEVSRRAATLYTQAPAYVQPLGYGTMPGGDTIIRSNVYDLLTGMTGTVAPSLANPEASEVVLVLADMFDRISTLISPDDALSVFQELSSFSVGEVIAEPQPLYDMTGRTGLTAISTSDQRNADNAAAMNGIVRSLALMQYARAASAVDFPDRPTAIQARADLVVAFNGQIDVLMDDAVVGALIEARDLAVKAISSTIANMAAVITIDASASMPSLFWADRLYRDADRADELIARNDVAIPAFMPLTFEALAS